MKPDWVNAPEWANWLAMNADGEWYWHENKPQWAVDSWYQDDDSHQMFAQKHAGSDLSNKVSWDSSLEERGKANECDHLLGIFAGVGEDEYVYESTKCQMGADELQACQAWLAAGGGHPISNKIIKSLDTPEKALAARTDFFNFCPRCGTRLGQK